MYNSLGEYSVITSSTFISVFMPPIEINRVLSVDINFGLYYVAAFTNSQINV